MKIRVNFTIDEIKLSELDKWAFSKQITRSEAIEQLINKIDLAEQNLSQFFSIVKYNPTYEGAAVYNKVNMNAILERFKEYKNDPSFFINSIILSKANEAFKQEVISKGLLNEYGEIKKGGRMSANMAALLVQSKSKMAKKLGLTDLDGNSIGKNEGVDEQA